MVQKKDLIKHIMILLVINTIILTGAEAKKFEKPYSTLYFMTGQSFSTGSPDFFKNYMELTGGTEQTFSMTPFVGGALKVRFWDKARLALSLDYTGSELHEKFTQPVNENFSRDVEEHINVSTIPVLLMIETLPLDGQFRTYAGIGGGIVLSHIRWQERIFSTWYEDPRKSGIKFEDRTIYPAIRFSAGLELGFDKRGSEGFIAGVVIETNYSYIFRTAKLFTKIAEELNIGEKYRNETFSVLSGFIGLNIGLAFNINRV